MNINWDDPVERAALIERVGIKAYNAAQAAHNKATTIETVAGHAIRPVGSRFGKLFLVGGTGLAFSTFEEATAYAVANPNADAAVANHDQTNALTLDQFALARQQTQDVGLLLGLSGEEGKPGFCYPGGCFITQAGDQYYLIIGSNEWMDHDLSKLEKILHEKWYLPECSGQ